MLNGASGSGFSEWVKRAQSAFWCGWDQFATPRPSVRAKNMQSDPFRTHATLHNNAYHPVLHMITCRARSLLSRSLSRGDVLREVSKWYPVRRIVVE